MRLVKSHEILWTPKLLRVVMKEGPNGKIHPHAMHQHVHPASFLEDAVSARDGAVAVWFYYLNTTWSWSMT